VPANATAVRATASIAAGDTPYTLSSIALNQW
jgi:hypothetical protein